MCRLKSSGRLVDEFQNRSGRVPFDDPVNYYIEDENVWVDLDERMQVWPRQTRPMHFSRGVEGSRIEF